MRLLALNEKTNELKRIASECARRALKNSQLTGGETKGI
jgi:hypothetical protein